jgi:hypothetical protein
LPFTVKLGGLNGVLGIWKRELAAAGDEGKSRVLVDDARDLGEPYHWSVSSWIGVNDEVGLSMPKPLWTYWPAAK